ncbi:MAG: 50S ribosomal protein L11 methyltransferase [Gammaproteobacteria bacterium]|nr:50S ribosomal protein L11 methyltransferase [Gammaproteobacteria bacterium]MCW9031276.1 50S ribosomal protein L11 methyltransferase [Gammaproteobacteria bacterium]
MTWLQLIIPTDESSADLLSDALMEQGAVSVTLQDMQNQPVLEPAPGTTPMWSQTRVVGLFDASQDLKRVMSNVEQQLEKKLPNWKGEQLEDKDWVRAWMDDFKPMQFGENLWVVPSTFEPPQPEAVNILLDPGLAFGTGTHPTTSMCLEWLDANPPVGKDIIDFGCGSGILAIGAILLGAKHAEAIDLDPQALLATHDNAEKNHVADKIKTYLPNEYSNTITPLLLANILASPLIELAPYFAKLTSPQGQIVLSGILAEQAEDVLAAYQANFDIQIWKQHDDWVCLAGRRK